MDTNLAPKPAHVHPFLLALTVKWSVYHVFLRLRLNRPSLRDLQMLWQQSWCLSLLPQLQRHFDITQPWYGRYRQIRQNQEVKAPWKHIQANNYNSSWAVISSQEVGFEWTYWPWSFWVPRKWPHDIPFPAFHKFLKRFEGLHVATHLFRRSAPNSNPGRTTWLYTKAERNGKLVCRKIGQPKSTGLPSFSHQSDHFEKVYCISHTPFSN